jgi:hypothetical protein
MKALHELMLLLFATWSCLADAINNLFIFKLVPRSKHSRQSVKRDEHVGTTAAAAAAAPSGPIHQHQTTVDPADSQFWLDAAEKCFSAEQRAAFEQQFHSLGYACYAVPGGLQELRNSQFPQLQNFTYLDHAATTLYSVQQLAAAHAELSQQLFANPHSQLGSGLDATPAAVEQLRLLTLRMLNAPADEYEVSFTTSLHTQEVNVWIHGKSSTHLMLTSKHCQIQSL